jgi:hypothetical protein
MHVTAVGGHGFRCRAYRRLGARLLRALHPVGNPDHGRADSSEVVFLCITDVWRELPLLPHRARARSGGSSERQPGRSFTASTGLSPDGGLQAQPHRTGFAVGIGLRRWDDITLGDGEGQGERA